MRLQRRRLVLSALAALISLVATARTAADTPPEPKPARRDRAKAGPSLSADWFGAWKSFKDDLRRKTGTSISMILDYHTQAVLNGPGEGRERDLFWWNLTLKQRLWKGAELVVKARGNSGNEDPPDGIVPLVRPRLNVDWSAFETECGYVANVYLAQKLLNDKLLIVAGKLTFPSFFDTNKFGSWDFLSCSLARNAAFPHRYHTVGALVRYDPVDWLYVQAGVSDAEGIRSETGLNTAFHGEDYVLGMFELGLKTRIRGLEGNYRFDVWYDGRPLNRHDGRGPERDNVGFGVSFDQQLTPAIGAFFRYGWNDGRVSTFSNYWSLGGAWTGPIPRRKKDVLGLGFGQGITSGAYRRARNATSTETISEVYYKIHLTEWCALFLNLETLINPGTNGENDVSVIPGLRLKLTF